MDVNYSALSELHPHCAILPGATRLTLFGACPWLSYSAPSALDRGYHISRLRRWTVAFIFRAFGAQFRLFVQSPPFGLCTNSRYNRRHFVQHLNFLCKSHVKEGESATVTHLTVAPSVQRSQTTCPLVVSERQLVGRRAMW